MRAVDFVEIAPERMSARVGGGILFEKLVQELTLEKNLTTPSTPFAGVPSIGGEPRGIWKYGWPVGIRC
jgi:hypothetical protein